VAEAPGRRSLTDEELALVPFFHEFWEAFSELPQLHPADPQEATFTSTHSAGSSRSGTAHRAHPPPGVIKNRSGTPI
jgi:hypothetical protein